MKQKIDFIKSIKIWGIIFLTSLAVIFIVYEAFDSYQHFNLHADNMRKNNIARQKVIVKQEVNQVVDLINYKIEEATKTGKQIEGKLLKTISRIRFGKEGYIFINKLNGDALVSNGRVFSETKKLWEVFNSNKGKMKELFQMEYDAAIKPKGDFIYYSFVKLSDSTIESPKVSFIQGVPNLEWLVGAGVYLDDIEKEITLMKDELSGSIKLKLIYLIVVVVVIIAIFLFLFNIFFNKIKDDFHQFELFFQNVAYKDESINIANIKFTQFEEMAKNANNMLKDKVKAQQDLIDEREQLFVTIHSVGDALITTDADGKIDLMNKVAEKLTGWKNEEAKGKELTEIFNIINENSREQVENPVSRVLSTGQIIGLANHTILISKDGVEYNISDSAAPINDVKNNVRGVVLVFRDITEEYKLQEVLRVHEERLDLAMSAANDGLWDWDLANNSVYFDPRYFTMAGYEINEFPHTLEEFQKRVHPEDVGHVMSVSDNYIKGKIDNFNVEFRFRHKDGNWIWINGRGKIVTRNSSGNPVRFVGTHSDVTERKQIEETLKVSEERYSRLSSITYEGILIHSGGVAIDLNSTFEKIFGYSREELLGKNIIDLIVPPKHHKIIFEMMQSEIATPYEVEGIRKDDSIIPVEIESRNIDYGDNEEVRVTAIRDITQRKRSELQILKFSNAIEQTPVSIVITNIDGNIEYVNPKFTEITGYTFEEAYNQNPRVLKSGEQPDEYYKNLWKTISSGNIWSGEFHNKKKNGELFWESAIISPIKDEDEKIIHYVAAKEDITEKKAMLNELITSKEKAENADKMKSIFLAQMSHEIRTPINALVSMSSLLRYDFEESADEDQLMSFDIIDRAGGRIIRTIDLLLNLSEIQAGTYETHLVRFDILSDVIFKIIAENKMLAKNKNIELNLKHSVENSELVADHYTVNQIFTQLIDNAIKYTEKGEVSVSVDRNELDQLVIEIKDTGIGIEKTYLPSLFEPFSQEDMGYTRKFEGNGIGMTLVNKYCELNNAKIEVESEKGVGSIFRVVFG